MARWEVKNNGTGHPVSLRLTPEALLYYERLQNHRRFYYALVLLEILHEVSLATISQRLSQKHTTCTDAW